MSNQYMLFTGQRFYPKGGMEDFRMKGTMQECLNYKDPEFEPLWGTASDEPEWGQIADAETLKVVLVGEQLNYEGPLVWKEPE